MTSVALSLGSNLGDRIGQLTRGRLALEKLGRVTAHSSLYATSPVDVMDQPDFLNAAVLMLTDRAPLDLLVELKRIEAELGGPRRPGKGPRHFDVDIVFYGELSVAEPQLRIPHTAWAERRFVVDPLCEIDPGRRVPPSLATVADLVATLAFPDQVCRRLPDPW